MKKLSGGRSLAVLAVAGGAVLASVAPVMAEVSAESPSVAAVEVKQRAKIKALGAVAEVQVTYACPRGSVAAVSLSMSQSVFGGIASGEAFKSSLNCTDAFETVTVNVVAEDKAFQWGPAFARATITGYPPSYSARDERVIDLRFF